MKRTLIEVSCGLAALVGMVSMYHKVDRIEGRTTEVLNLRDQVQSAVEKVASAPKDDREKAELQAMQSRLAQLQEQLQKAEAGSALALRLQSEMQSAKSDVSLLKSQLSTDVERTKQLVDAYITESRNKEREAAAAMVHTQGAIAAIAGQLRRDTGYNTYLKPGLPKGPIANPGRDSIMAVLDPAETDALYFVADGSGGHVFGKTLAEHNANVARWFALRRQRGEM